MPNIYKPKLLEFETTDSLIKRTVDYIEDRVLYYESEQGIVRLLLSGGQTPLPIYQKLGKSSTINWSGIELFQTDERFVKIDDESSNQLAITRSFNPEIINLCREVNFIDTSSTIDEAINDYSEKLDALDGVWFDIVLLGIGKDGHIASLFTTEDLNKKDLVIHSQNPDPNEVKERVSLSVNSILNAREIMVFLTGENKSAVIGELIEGQLTVAQFPAKVLYGHPNVSVFFCLQ